MSYALDLASARAKLKRAKAHIDELRGEITDAGKPDPKLISLRHEFEPEQGAIVYRIEHVMEIGDDWPLLVGDAVHNLRSTLDHLAWQLAIRHFKGVEPQNRGVIRNIQFPIVSNKNDWPTHPHRKYMSKAAAAKLKGFQPFKLDAKSRAAGSLHPFESLKLLDDLDKHRNIHLLNSVAHQGTFVGPTPPDITDCVPLTRNGGTLVHLRGLTPPPHPNQEVAVVPLVTVTGPHPNVELHARLTGYVAVRETWDVLNALDTITKWVDDALSLF